MTDTVHRLTGEWMTPRRQFLSAMFRGRIDKVPARR